jgi:hypothetical protein
MSAWCWKASSVAAPPAFFPDKAASVARRPNYGQQRAEINRGKLTKQAEKQREREEAVARRKQEREGGPLPEEPAADEGKTEA